MFLLQPPVPKRGLHHVAFAVRDIHEVFGGGLHISQCGWETELGPGRHPISSAIFLVREEPGRSTGGILHRRGSARCSMAAARLPAVARALCRMGCDRRDRRKYAPCQGYSEMSAETIVVVGAGQAGGWAAKTLRSEGFTGRIMLVGNEAHPPHERPPLSKAVLAGTVEPDSTHLFKRDAYAELGLDVRAGVGAAADRALVAHGRAEQAARRSHMTAVILCTGSAPRKLGAAGRRLAATALFTHHRRCAPAAPATCARRASDRDRGRLDRARSGRHCAQARRKRHRDRTVAADLCARGAAGDFRASAASSRAPWRRVSDSAWGWRPSRIPPTAWQ